MDEGGECLDAGPIPGRGETLRGIQRRSRFTLYCATRAQTPVDLSLLNHPQIANQLVDEQARRFLSALRHEISNAYDEDADAYAFLL